MNEGEVPPYTVEDATEGPGLVWTVLVRFAGGRRVRVVVPVGRVSDVGITDAIAAAWRHLRPLPGPHTTEH